MAKILRSILASSTTVNASSKPSFIVKTKRTIEHIIHSSNNKSNFKGINKFDSLEHILPLQDIDSIGYNRRDGKIDKDNTSPDSVYSFTTSTRAAAAATATATTTRATIIGPNNYVPFFASPASDIYNKTIQAQLLEAERARIRAEFFATYDVMTGVRIAATLGGFFGLMVFLIVWKSRSSSNETMKVLKDPKMAAVAAVCMQEEEEREIHEAMVATGMSIYPDEYDAILYRRQRMLSLGNVSAPPMLNRGFRFSSVGGGGYNSLLEPPRRFSLSSTSGALSIGGGSYAGSRRRSASETSRVFNNYAMGSSFGTDDYFIETDDELENDTLDHGENSTPPNYLDHKGSQRTDSTKSKQGFLQVPLTGPDSRRSSAMTCCSTDSSYLERRYSAYTLGMRNLPPTLQRKSSTVSRTSSTDNWDYYYPDIQVTEATPKTSPYPSEHSIYEKVKSSYEQNETIKAMGQDDTIKQKDIGVIIVPTTKSDTHFKSKTASPQSSKISISDAPSIQVTTSSSVSYTPKHSIPCYDIENVQSGCKQKIQPVTTDTVDIYPYNQPLSERGIYESPSQNKKSSSATQNIYQSGQFKNDLYSQEPPLSKTRRKVGVVEITRMPFVEEKPTNGSITAQNLDINNSFSHKHTNNSSSISADSSPLSIDKLNESGSLGTISARALFTANRRAPLASLSSFKISSLDYQDSEMRSLDEDSAFLESAADTDEDLQQLSSDSEEVSLSNCHNHELCRQDQQILESISIDESNFSLEVKKQSHQVPAREKTMLRKAPTVCTTNVRSSESFTANTRARRALLQRHRTISVSSSERVVLLGQQLTELPNSGTQTSISSVDSKVPIETLRNSDVTSNALQERGQLLHQCSDPYSQLTTITTADEDIGSIHNIELDEGLRSLGTVAQFSGAQDSCRTLDVIMTSSIETGISTVEGRTSATLTQDSSLTTVLSFGRISPLVGSQLNITHSENSMIAGDVYQSSLICEQQQQIQKKPEKLPLSLIADDHCASSTSDSCIINHHQLVTDKPSSTYPNILGLLSTAFSRSATNLSNIKELTIMPSDHHSPPYSTVLEIPLINLPIGDNTSNSSDNSLPSEYNAKIKNMKNKSDDTPAHYTSLPGSSRKLSRETLF